MRDNKLNDLLKLGGTGKSSNNSQLSRRKSFGYQILGFGSGGAGGPVCIAFDYLIAGGGGGGSHAHGPGGGGAGGVRHSFCNPSCAAITLNTDCGPIAVTIAAGGAKTGSFDGTGSTGGTSSMFNCKPVAIPMGGGGGGGGRRSAGAGSPCGSGGGAGCNHAGGVQPGGSGGTYGNNGAPSQSPCFTGGGGGGACAAAPNQNGGNGKQISITGSSVNYGCGGGGGSHNAPDGAGGRGDGGAACNGSDLPTANQGGGGGGNGAPAGATGVVILRFPTACKPAGMSITPGDNTITTTGSCTLLTFTVSGSASF
jgi:hypothetical protein